MPVMPLSSFLPDTSALLTPSERGLWQALTSGRVLLPSAGDGAWCTVSPEAPFAGLFDVHDVVQRQAQHRLKTVLWSYTHRWSDAAQHWAVDQVRAVPLDRLKRCASEVFEHPVAPAHANDGLLAYAWWGGVPVVFEALRQRGLMLENTYWGGMPLLHWLQQAQDRSGTPRTQWAGALLAQRERNALHPLLDVEGPTRMRARL